MPDCEAMVLCAGLGTRLRPLTLERAKPAVPLLDRPLVAWSFDRIRQLDVSTVAINTHWLPETMVDAAADAAQKLGLKLTVSHEEQVLGTGGGVWQARERGLFERGKPLLIMNGDVYFDIDLSRVVARHLASGAHATMVLRPMPAGGSYNPILKDETGRVLRIRDYEAAGKSDGAMFLFTGVHVLSPEALDLLPSGESDIVDRVYGPLLENGAFVQSVVETGRWLDLGDPSGYLDAHLQLAPEGLVDPGAKVSSRAKVVRSVVGAGAVIEAGAKVEDCVLWPGSRVQPGEELSRVIVTGKGQVRVPNRD